jgi:hypothetical protein
VANFFGDSCIGKGIMNIQSIRIQLLLLVCFGVWNTSENASGTSGPPTLPIFPHQYDVATGSGGVGDPLIIHTYEIDEMLQTKLVRTLWYVANVISMDTLDAAGTGAVGYMSWDIEKTEHFQWNRPAFADPTGTNVLMEFGGYDLKYIIIDDYDVGDHNRARENINDYWYSNATEPVLDPPVDATRLKTGAEFYTEETWNLLHEYKTVEINRVTDLVTTMKNGIKVERSEIATDPFNLNVKTTVWDGGTLTPTGWVQGETVTNTIELGPWPMPAETLLPPSCPAEPPPLP